MHAGRGPGLSQRNLGAEFGSETNTLNVNQLPSHNHLGQITGNIFMPVSANPPDTDSPNAAYLTQQADDFYHTPPKNSPRTQRHDRGKTPPPPPPPPPVPSPSHPDLSTLLDQTADKSLPV